MSEKNEWESIGYCCRRLKVPKRWLVLSYQHNNDGVSNSVTFVPDPTYAWKI